MEVELPVAALVLHGPLSIAQVRYTVLAVGKVKPPYADDDAVARRIPERAFVCMLDDRGTAYDSQAFARWVEARRQGGRDVCFVVGGPYGTELDRCDHRLSLGPMTLPHQLARVVLLEQLFRAHKILAGEPYHH